jgi:SAM-dependent methyltransferase
VTQTHDDGAAGGEPALHHDADYFDRMYATTDDPWGFEVSWYERRKYAVTLALLPQARYGCAYEPGCSNGALSELLQARCDRLYASELVPRVADRARARLAQHDHVEVRTAAFPDWWPGDELDLVVLSEIAYYLTDAGRAEAERAIETSLVTGGDLVAVHYTGETDYPMRGEDVANWLDSQPWLDAIVRHRDGCFEAGVWRRRATANGHDTGRGDDRGDEGRAS